MIDFLNILKEVTKYIEYYNQNDFDVVDTKFQINKEDPYFKYLHENNKLLKLYHFIQNDEGSFIRFQKKYGILWGLFAFIDTDGIYKNRIRYLFGPYDDEVEDLSLHPHFLIKVLCRDINSELVPEEEWYAKSLAKIAYCVRQKETSAEFVEFFNNLNVNGSQIEKENEVLFIPTSEIDYYLLRLLSGLCDSKGTISAEKFTEYFNQDSVLGTEIIKKFQIQFKFFSGKKDWNKLLEWMGIYSNNLRSNRLLEFVKNQNGASSDLSFEKFKGYIDNAPPRFSLPIHLFARVSQRKFNQSHGRFLLGFPIARQPGENNIVGFAMIIVEDDYTITPEEFSHRISKLKAIFGLLGESEYREVYLNGLVKANEKIQKEASIKAAISQVMARNGSHNLGSHVLDKLTSSLENKDFNIRNYEDSLFKINDHHSEESISHCFDNFKKPIPKCSGLTIAQLELLNGYVKNRMEYLGDLAMNTPMMSSSKYLINDLFRDFDKVRLLLDNISGLDNNFKYSFRFIINGRNINQENWKQEDIKLAITNDITGCQAFYNILENIIRNTAKHSESMTEDVVFTIEVNDTESKYGENADEFWQINVYDNVKKDNIDGKIKNQNEILNMDVLDDISNSLRQTSLGMIEMDASAAYLRRMDIAQINSSEFDLEHDITEDIYKSKSKKLPILNAAKFKNEQSSNLAECLGYRFYIEKPKEFLFVFENIDCYIENIKYFIKKGIYFLTLNDFKKQLETKKTFTHQFVLTNLAFNPEIMQYNAQYSPRVIYLNNNNDLVKTLYTKLENSENIDLEVWKIFREKLIGNNNQFSIKTSSFSDIPEKYEILIADHSFSSIDISKKLSNLDCNLFSSYNVLNSLAKTKLPSYNNKDGTDLASYLTFLDENPQIKIMLGEASFNRVVVIDERIQKHAESEYTFEGKQIKFYALYQAMNVFMPKWIEEINSLPNELLETFEYDLNAKKLEEQLIDNIKKLVERIQPTFLVIHYGILERVYGEHKQKKIPLLLKSWQSTFTNTQIIITSGRTRVENLPNGIRFVNLAPLLTAFTEIRSKFEINKLLNDSRI